MSALDDYGVLGTNLKELLTRLELSFGDMHQATLHREEGLQQIRDCMRQAGEMAQDTANRLYAIALKTFGRFRNGEKNAVFTYCTPAPYICRRKRWSTCGGF